MKQQDREPSIVKRRLKVKKQLENQLVSGVKTKKEGPVALSIEDRKRIQKEITILSDRLSGKKKNKKVVEGVKEEEKDKWVMDIYSITYGYVKRSERKKNKGKSRKKLKRQKSVSLVRSIVVQPGMVENYRQGKAGISPRTHKFTLRKEEPSII